MKKISLIVIVGMISIAAFSYDQNTLAISKAELLHKIPDKNLQLKIADQEFKSAQADYRQSNAFFYQILPFPLPPFRQQIP